MKQLLASLTLAAASATPLFWWTVAPHGAELCNSSTEFQTVSDTEANRSAARHAKTAFCKVVTENPAR